MESIGDRIASTLTPEAAEALLADLGRTYSGHYVANIAATMLACVRWGARAKHIEHNPIEGFRSPTLPRSPERYGTRQEAAAYLLHAWRHAAGRTGDGPRYGRLTVLLQRCLVRTGARPGELCGLRWEDLRWDARRTPAGHAYALAKIPPTRWKAGRKTGRWRTIYFTPALTRALRREFERPDRSLTHVFVHGHGRGGHGLAEPWPNGSRLSQTVRASRRLAIADQADARRRAEAREPLSAMDRRLLRVEILDAGPQRLTAYRWRHTAASTLLMIGIDPSTIAELLGTSAEMISRVYGHLLDAHVAAAAEQLARPRKRR